MTVLGHVRYRIKKNDLLTQLKLQINDFHKVPFQLKKIPLNLSSENKEEGLNSEKKE